MVWLPPGRRPNRQPHGGEWRSSQPFQRTAASVAAMGRSVRRGNGRWVREDEAVTAAPAAARGFLSFLFLHSLFSVFSSHCWGFSIVWFCLQGHMKRKKGKKRGKKKKHKWDHITNKPFLYKDKEIRTCSIKMKNENPTSKRQLCFLHSGPSFFPFFFSAFFLI